MVEARHRVESPGAGLERLIELCVLDGDGCLVGERRQVRQFVRTIFIGTRGVEDQYPEHLIADGNGEPKEGANTMLPVMLDKGILGVALDIGNEQGLAGLCHYP